VNTFGDALARLTATSQVHWTATLFTRLALGFGFLSAVADRFGFWGPAGEGHVAGGNFDAFIDYVRALAPYLPAQLCAVVAWAATAIEIVLGIALVLGVAVRWTALASAGTLVVFAMSMFLFSGFETPLSASVFSAAAAALILALHPPGGDDVSIDHLRRSRRAEQKEPK